MYEHVIAIDLETTGVEAARDEILELGAAVYAEGRIVDRFSALCRITRPLSPAVVKLTGITPDLLAAEARDFDEVLPEFLSFLERGGDTLFIAHAASFDRAFLMEKSKGLFEHRMLDTVGLARICFPTLESHALGFLVEALEIPPQEAHRALGDAVATIHLWERMLEALNAFPREYVNEVNRLLAPLRTHPYHELFQRLARQRFSRDFGGGARPFAALFPSNKDILEKKPPVREIDRDHGKLDLQAVEAVFSADGALAQTIPGFESREGQREMAIEVAQCINEDRHLMVEAPTGIGKSLAYLVPAALFSEQEDFPVILSTNTKNLQAQLFEKDIPKVKEALGLNFEAAIIKGRGNYLCLRKLFYVLEMADRELDRDERMQMVTLLSWAIRTQTGDVAECVLTGRPDFGALWAKLRTLGDECTGRGCKSFQRCFLRKARAKSMAADLVVANHALVFAELNMESAVLPPYGHIVFDEAHNLEDAATDHLTVEVTQARLFQVLGRLYRPRKRGRPGGRGARGARAGTGLAASILAALGSDASKAPEELGGLLEKHCDAILKNVEAAQERVKPFLQALAKVLPGRKAVTRQRFAAEKKLDSVWQPIEESKVALVAALAQVMRPSESAVEALREMPPGSIPYLRDYQRELEAVVQWLREVIADTEFVLAGTETNYVYWVERTSNTRGGALACAAPLSIAELMHDQVYARKRACVFSSATLTVRDRFDFLAGRLGIDRIAPDRLVTLQAPSPFDYDEQCLVAVPTFLPEPGGQGEGGQYVEDLSNLLSHVYRASQGRGLSLFTSYAMLKACYKLLEEALLGDGIAVLAQGESGSREGITARFMRDVHSVLLGTHSFWEGVDVVGEALSCLTIARLPFAVFTDPIVEARCEQVEAQGKGAFMHYSVPNAVIRFKQGFGRLIRSRNDRGLVIIADRRVVAKRYGQVFLDSLPTEAVVYNDRTAFLEDLEAFFEEGDADG
jgi:DNA polymerase III epsilon subunit family exonuclease